MREGKTGGIEITNKTKAKLPSLPFLNIKNRILGKKYELSLVFIGDATSKKLNKIYRNKDKPTDILSFTLTKTSGEIFINLKYAQKKAKKFGRKPDNFIGFLFIHGLLHLKGFDHSSKMESEEEKIRKSFSI